MKFARQISPLLNLDPLVMFVLDEKLIKLPVVAVAVAAPKTADFSKLLFCQAQEASALAQQ